MAAKLILSMDGAIIKEYALIKERMTIGRKPHNDIIIDNLAVSGEHAAVVTILNDSFLEDMDSTNGLEVNGQATKKHFLQSNDVIGIGKYKLKFINDQVAQATSADFEKTMVLRSPVKQTTPVSAAVKPADASSFMPAHASSKPLTQDAADRTGKFETSQPMVPPPKPVQTVAPVIVPASVPAPAPPKPTQPLVAVPAPQVSGASRPVAVVQVLTGPNAGKELELVKNLTTIGKPGMQVAVLTRRPHGFFITHVEGENFPLVNGQALTNQAHQLNEHDVIDLAGVKMEFFYKG